MAWVSILWALWLFLPAYVANMSPVFVAKLLPRWKTPIDGGRLARDGRRLLGPGKTWRGLAGGAVAGGAVALLLAYLAPPQGHAGWFAGLDFGLHGVYGPPTACQVTTAGPAGVCAGAKLGQSSPAEVFLFGAIIGTMALVGDAMKSYFKRRRGKEGGAPWFPFDQLDFVVLALLGMLLASPLLPAGWVWHALTDDWVTLATLLVLTPALHLLVNQIGYRLRLKDVPW